MEVNESKGDKAEERWGQFFILSLFRLFLLTSLLRPGSVCLFRTPLQFFVWAVEVLLPKAGDFCPAGELRAWSASPVSTSLRLLARELWICGSLVRIPVGIILKIISSHTWQTFVHFFVYGFILILICDDSFWHFYHFRHFHYSSCLFACSPYYNCAEDMALWRSGLFSPPTYLIRNWTAFCENGFTMNETRYYYSDRTI